MASWRMPRGGSSVISTSAIRLLLVGSHPGNSMPAALRMTLRPPSHPTRYCARSDWPSEQLDVDAGVVLREARHLTSVIDPHRQLGDPGGHDPLDLVLPDPERIRMTRREVAHVQHGRGRTSRPEPPGPPRGTDRRPHADRAPRSCASESRRPVSRRARDRDAARRPRRRPSPTPTQPPASSPSDRLRRSPPHARSSPHSRRIRREHTRIPLLHSFVSGLRRAIMRHDPGLHEAPVRGINWK